LVVDNAQLVLNDNACVIIIRELFRVVHRAAEHREYPDEKRDIKEYHYQICGRKSLSNVVVGVDVDRSVMAVIAKSACAGEV